MSDYSFGLNFLKQWFNSSYRGVLTFQGAIAKYSTDQISSLGKMVRGMPSNKWRDVITLANKEFTGSSVPPKSYWNSYILAVGGSIDYGKIAGEVAVDTFDFIGSLSKYGLLIAGVALVAGVVVYAGNASGKSAGFLKGLKNAWKN